MSRSTGAPQRAQELAHFLGWFSIGLGAVELHAAAARPLQ
jgi:hypothetical protein